MSGPLLEEEWAKVGLTVLSSDEDRSLVLFSSSDELADFRRKLEAYGLGVRGDQVNPSYGGFIANVEAVASVAVRSREAYHCLYRRQR